jgi:hypothetical protein
MEAVKVGVRLPRQVVDLGGWLADGAAFDAAGADALWVDVVAEPDLDPLVALAALASVTSRALLVTTVTHDAGPADALARTLRTIGRLSRGRVRVVADAEVEGVGMFRRSPDSPDVYEYRAERWVTVPLPDSRATWLAAVAGAGTDGTGGLVVPADPRLLDLLRNPGSPGERHDLELTIG